MTAAPRLRSTALRITALRIGGALCLALPAGSVLADEPGPGGTRVPVPVTGEQVYQSVCQACHMADARGATGAATVPALAGNPKLASSAYLLMMITQGRGAMPSIADTLKPAQIAAVATYVRTHFGNTYPAPVTAAEVPPAPRAN
jgi:mono/diheme cytochrome c family protein